MNIQTLYRPIALISIVSLVLASTFTGVSVSADSSNADEVPGGQLIRRGLSGTVVAVGSGDFVLETRKGNVTINVSDSTIIKSGKEIVDFSEMKVGDRAGVLLDKSPDRPGKGDDDGDGPDVTPPTDGDDSGTDVDVTPPSNGDDSGSDVDVTPPDNGDDSGSDVDVTPPDNGDDSGSDVDVTPPDNGDDSGSDVDVTPPDNGDDSGSDVDVTPPNNGDDSGSDVDVTPPNTGSDSGTDVEPSVTPVPPPAPSFRQDVTALRITIIPSKATRSLKCGVITSKGGGKTNILNEDGSETELDGEEGTEGEDTCVITRGKKGGGEEVTGSTDPGSIDDRLARFAEKNPELAEKLAEKQADQRAKRDARLERTLGNAPADKRGKAQDAIDRKNNRGSGGSGNTGSGGGASGSGSSGNPGGGNSDRGNSGNSGGGNSGNSGKGNNK